MALRIASRCSLLTWSNLLAILSALSFTMFSIVWIVSVAFNCKQFPWLSSSNREEYAPYKWTGLIKSSLRSAGSFTIRRNSLRMDSKSSAVLNLQQWIVRLLVQLNIFFLLRRANHFFYISFHPVLHGSYRETCVFDLIAKRDYFI